MTNYVSFLKHKFFILIIFSQSSFSQRHNCSECNSKIYTKEDISHLTLLELKILRNEIFARHQFVFKDTRLEDYFLGKYDWYKPNNASENTIKLNNFEKENIRIILKFEKEKKALQKTIIKELETFKTALNTDETATINSIINNVTKDFSTTHKNDFVSELKSIVSKIDIQQIHWYNENGLYKITTDDGYSINERAITIKGSKVIMSYSDIGHSELLNDETAFNFGSAHYSENEYASWFTFTIIDGKLILLEHQAAG